MKRMLAAMLTALMLVTILPLASPPARAAVTNVVVKTCRDSAFVGETIRWYVSYMDADPTDYEFRFFVYRNGELVAPENFHPGGSRFYTFHSPGNYYVEYYLRKYGECPEWIAESDVITVSASPNKITKVEPLSATSLKITLNTVPGAAGYELWRNSGTGWEWRADIYSGTSYTDTGLKAGTRYFYKVRYYRDFMFQYSWFSAAVAGVPMGKTRITSITSPAKGRVRLAWAKAEGASGYQVLVATSARGSYKPVRQLTGTTVTFTGLKSGSGLYYKIRPYRRVYTTTCWGQDSAYRSIRVK